jgi:predicted GIY-YIG superfamily endonuclease
MFYVYMLRCRDNSLYIGHTDDLDRRLAEHRSRRFCGYTAKRLPVRLIWQDNFPTRDEAFAAERQIKGWSRGKKLALAQGDWELVQRLSLRRTPQPESYSRRSALLRDPQDERKGVPSPG